MARRAIDRPECPAVATTAILFAPVVTILLVASQAKAITNVITDLGTLGGATSEANAVNDSGQVTGASDTPTARRAFLYSGGVMTDLGTLGGVYSEGRGINNAGDVAGVADLSGAPAAYHAVLWSAGATTDLDTLLGPLEFGYSEAEDINDAGQIVGVSSVTGGTSHPFRYSGGVMTDLGTLGGALDFGWAYGINAAGDVVGFTTGAAWRPFYWSAGIMTDLAAAAGLPYEYDAMDALAVNAAGEAVGIDRVDGRAVLFAGGTVTDLGTPAAFASWAYDINDAGQIVGVANRFTLEFTRAVIYNAGQLIDVNKLLPPGSGWRLLVARGISNTGHIVGWGYLNNGSNNRAFRLSLGAGCANGLLDGGESCDDGNTIAGDGCSASCAVEASWQCDGQPTVCRISDRPIDGVKLVMKRSASGDKLVFVSKDPNALFPAPGGPDDPTVVGASVDLFTDTEWAGTYELPAGNWETSGSGLVHKFVNSTAPGGVSGVRVAKLGQGTSLRIVARTLPLEWYTRQRGAGIRIRVGRQWNCARFAPATVVKDDTSIHVFVARGALSTDISDCSEASLH